MSNENQPPRVVVTDIHMPFGSMVVFMVKWAFAAIPAMLILFCVGFALVAVLGGIVGALGSSMHKASAPDFEHEAKTYASQSTISTSDYSVTTNVPQFASRCKGSPEVAKCIALEKSLVDETPAQRKARQLALEAEREANMALVR